MITLLDGRTFPTSARDPATLASLAVGSLASPHSRRAYAREITRYLEVGRTLTREGVQAHMNALRESGAGPITRNVALAAVRLLAREANVRGELPDTELSAIERVRSVPVRGTTCGNWLTAEAAECMLDAAAQTDHAARNGALLACLIGCGLRRSEVCGLTWEQWQRRDGRYVWVNIQGKGGRVRSVPCPGWAAELIDQWRQTQWLLRLSVDSRLL